MKPFVVVFTLRPAARLPNNVRSVELKFPEPEGEKRVLVTKVREESAGVLVQTGLKIRVFLNAANVNEAISNAKSFADGITSLITLITGRGMEIPREEIAYELSPGVKEREFLQVFYDVPFKITSRREIEIPKLTDFIDRLTQLPKPTSEHIARAVRWYRLGAMVDDFCDQFNCFWIGLEALNPLLQQKLSVKDDTVKCPECEHEWITTPTVSGVRKFVQDVMNEKGVYRKIRGLRIDIMHSTQELRSLQQLASEYVPRTGEILFRAICFLLEFDDWKKLTHGSVLREFPMRGELQGVLIGGTAESLGPDGQDPHFEFRHEIKETVSGQGSIRHVISTALDVKLNSNVSFRGAQLRLYEDSETKGEILDITLHKSNGKDVPIMKRPS